MVKNIKVVFGKKVPKGKETTKKRKKTTLSDDQRKELGGHEENETRFKKVSIFFKYLPYWKDLTFVMLLMSCMSRRTYAIASLGSYLT